MTDTCARRTVQVLALVLAVITVAGVWQPAVAQEEGSAPADSQSLQVTPVQREGIWVDIFLGTDVDKGNRVIMGEADTFPAEGNRVYCLTRVHGMTPPNNVTHVWYYEGKTMARVDLSVGSQNWRTWSSKSYQPEWTGNWEVKVLDQDGMVLGSAGFEVK